MMYPKENKKKHNKYRHISNDKPTYEDRCLVCDMSFAEQHEVFYGSAYLRTQSILYKCTERLCPRHHREGWQAVHNHKQFDDELKRKHQKQLEVDGMKRSEFIKIFGKNYIED